MPYRRRYYRKSYPRDKYSVEQSGGIITMTELNGAAVIVPPADLQGMRKVKHITISLATGSSANNGIIYWAVIYVPSGTQPSALTVNGTTLYEPNQFVMSAGVWDSEAGPNRITSPLSRNLNSGDQVYLILRQRTGAASTDISYVARYAVTLQ